METSREKCISLYVFLMIPTSPISLYISPYPFTAHYTILSVSDYMFYISVYLSMPYYILFYLTISPHIPLLYLIIHMEIQGDVDTYRERNRKIKEI